MSSFETILYEIQDNIATVTFNRPEKYNAFTKQMLRETASAFKQAGRDDAVRAVILTGAGKAFCTGQDLSDLDTDGLSLKDVVRQYYNPMVESMRGLEKPIIGALNGVVAGAGVGAALACDVRMMSSASSVVFAAFVSIGLIPDAGISFHLPQLVGPSKAFELLMLADGKNRVSPDDMQQLDLVRAVVEPDQLVEETQQLAAKFAAMPTRAIGMTKRLINATVNGYTRTQMLDMEAQLQEAAANTDDAKEGILAFLEKRSPNFQGK